MNKILVGSHTLGPHPPAVSPVSGTVTRGCKSQEILAMCLKVIWSVWMKVKSLAQLKLICQC